MCREELEIVAGLTSNAVTGIKCPSCHVESPESGWNEATTALCLNRSARRSYVPINLNGRLVTNKGALHYKCPKCNEMTALLAIKDANSSKA